jgi:carnitine O-acetyltransferase
MFDCSRVPGLHGKDWSVTFAKPSDKGDSGTVVFLRKGRVWKVDISKDGRLLGTEELERYDR